jgi:hypothetical protein
MTEIIDFLEKLGQDSRLRHAGCGEIRDALAHSCIDSVAAAAILARDERALAAHLAAPGAVCCLIFAPRKEEEAPQKEGEVPEQDAPDDNAPKSQQPRRVA